MKRERVLYIFPALIVLFIAIAAAITKADTTTTVGRGTAQDSYVHGPLDDGNFGSAGIFEVRGQDYSRSFIRFDLSGLDDVANIIEARIYLNVSTNPGSPISVGAYEVSSTSASDNWNEASLTWATNPCGSSRGSIGASCNPTPSSTVTVPTNAQGNRYSWDVTYHANWAYFNRASKSFTIMFTCLGSEPGNYVRFFSKEASIGPDAYPYLSVTYETSASSIVTFSGSLRDVYNNPVLADVVLSQVDVDYTDTTDANGNYGLSIPSGTYDLQYSIQSFLFPGYWVKMSSLDINSDMQNPLVYATSYEDRIALTFDVTGSRIIQSYSPDEPSRVLRNGMGLTKVSSLPELIANTWFYSPSEERVYLMPSSTPTTTQPPSSSTSSSTTSSTTSSSTTSSSTTTTIPGDVVMQELGKGFFTSDVMTDGTSVIANVDGFLAKNTNEGMGSWQNLTWQPRGQLVPIDAGWWIQLIFVDSRNNIFVSTNVGDPGGLYRSTDGGNNFQRVDWSTDGTFLDRRVMQPVMIEDDQGNLYIGYGQYRDVVTVYRSDASDAGANATWYTVYENDISPTIAHTHGLYWDPVNKWIYLLVGEAYSLIARSKDYGQTWETLYQPGWTMMGLGVRSQATYNEVYFGSDNYASNFEDRLFRLIDDGAPPYEVEEVLPLYNIKDPNGVRMTMIPFWIMPSPDNQYIFMGGSERKNYKDQGTTRVALWYSKTGDVYDGSNWEYMADFLVVQETAQGRFWPAHKWTKNGWLIVGRLGSQNSIRVCTSC